MRGRDREEKLVIIEKGSANNVRRSLMTKPASPNCRSTAAEEAGIRDEHRTGRQDRKSCHVVISDYC